MAERFQDLVMPVLLREAPDAYTSAIRRRRADTGHADMPRAGARVIGRIARGGLTVQEVGGAYGASRRRRGGVAELHDIRGNVYQLGRRCGVHRTDLLLQFPGHAQGWIDRVGCYDFAFGLTPEGWHGDVNGRIPLLRHQRALLMTSTIFNAFRRTSIRRTSSAATSIARR